MKKLFLVMCVLGVVLPYYQLYHFLLENNEVIFFQPEKIDQ